VAVFENAGAVAHHPAHAAESVGEEPFPVARRMDMAGHVRSSRGGETLR